MSFLELLREPTGDAIGRFLEAWHEPATRPMSAVSPGLLPEPVRRLAALANAWPSAFVQNNLEDDPDWARDADRRVF